MHFIQRNDQHAQTAHPALFPEGTGVKHGVIGPRNPIKEAKGKVTIFFGGVVALSA
jgi:hypothetical protein